MRALRLHPRQRRQATSRASLRPVPQSEGSDRPVFNGQLPFALAQGPDGSLYGTTLWGGDVNGYGTVFKVNATRVLSVLHAFTGGSDGAQPVAPRIHGHDGAFYGTTQATGAGSCAFTGLPSGGNTDFSSVTNWWDLPFDCGAGAASARAMLQLAGTSGKWQWPDTMYAIRRGA